MKQILVLLLAFSLFFISCSDNQHFRVEGNINDAKGEILYLEQLHLDRIQPIDSIKLGNAGRFSFKVKRPINPNFFRLRIKKKTIFFAVDSNETVQVNASCFSDDYKIKGSESIRKIKALCLSSNRLEKMIDEFETKYKNADIQLREQKARELNEAIEVHKQMARNVIYQNPRSTASYYAVFQKLNSFQVFDPYNSDDLKCYVAVADAYTAFYPHSIRGKHLTNLVLQARRANGSKGLKEILLEKIKGMIDISLPNIKGEEIILSSLKGQVVLLDLCYFKSEKNFEHVFSLRDLHQKYNTRGFEIYCVSFDSDFSFWKSASKDLAWICVHDQYSVNSDLLTMYKVEQLPTLFLIDKQGNIVSRHTEIDKQLYDSINILLDN